MKPFKLEEQSKIQSGFITPEDYFEKNANALMAQLQTTPKTISLWDRYKRPIWSAAAVLVIGLSIGMYWKIQTNIEVEAHWVAIESYVAEHADLTDEAYLDYVNEIALDTLLQNTTDTKVIEEVLLENGELDQYITQ
ncbi:MAG: hypothetical protein RL607_1175 [Bacteroidota bacterium]|jgi:hypothetical protein